MIFCLFLPVWASLWWNPWKDWQIQSGGLFTVSYSPTVFPHPPFNLAPFLTHTSSFSPALYCLPVQRAFLSSSLTFLFSCQQGLPCAWKWQQHAYRFLSSLSSLVFGRVTISNHHSLPSCTTRPDPAYLPISGKIRRFQCFLSIDFLNFIVMVISLYNNSPFQLT